MIYLMDEKLNHSHIDLSSSLVEFDIDEFVYLFWGH